MKVYFQHLDAPDRVDGIARLLLRRGRLQPHVLIFCPDEEFLRRLDDKLWTVHPESFLAHAPASGDPAKDARQPILLATEIVRTNRPEVLVNGAEELPPDLSGFSVVVDFVDAWDEALLRASRARYRAYRAVGASLQYLRASG